MLSNLFFDEVEKIAFLEKEAVLFEMKKLGTSYEIFISTQKPLIREIEASGVHRPDSLHVGLAIQSKCDCLATFNIRDFIPAEKWIKIVLPSDY